MSQKNNRRNLRKVNGVLLLDKPIGLTSNHALQEVKKLYQAQKAGHTGSLDPLATGLLPLCFGEATKVSAFLLDADKVYTMRCQLGVKTTTADAEGEVIETRPVPKLSLAQVEAVLTQFRGTIEQIPPMYSALKHQGQRLYSLARQGVVVERAPRCVSIHELTLRSFEPTALELEIHCSKGTYVRVLAEDIGETLGCGAHVTQLRRLEVFPYAAPNMISLSQLQALGESWADLDALLLPLESAVGHWPDVHLGADSAYYLGQGQAVLVPHAPVSGMVRIFGANNLFMGMGEIQSDGRVAPRRLFARD